MTRSSRLTAVLLLLCGATCAGALGGADVAAAAGPTWHAALDAGDGVALNDVSCASPTLCLAVGGSGVAAVEDGGFLFNDHPDLDHSLTAVSCVPGARFCVAADDAGQVVEWTGSFGSFSKIDGDESFESVSCPTTSFCMAIDDQDNVWRYSGSSWTGTPLTKPAVGDVQTDVSCASPSFCVAVSGASDGIRYAVWNGSGWSANTSKVSADNANPASLTCTSSTFCVLTTDHGKAARFGGASWTVTSVSAVPLVADCVATSCRAVDASRNTWTGDGTTWAPAGNTGTAALPGSPSAISCQASDLCVALAGADASVFGASLVPTTRPTLSGTGQVGQQLTVAPPQPEETRAWHAEAWWRCANPGSTCTRIPSAAGPTYQITGADTGFYLEARASTGVLLDEDGGFGSFISNSIHVEAPPSPPVAPKVSGKVKTSKSSASIPLGCSVACAGKLVFKVKSKTVGKASYSIAAGAVDQVKVKLSKAARKPLARRHKLKVTMILTPTDGTPITQSLTLKR